MFFYQGLACPHCNQAFDEHDDIVACPVCGAPHHRDCWKEHGGCACAADHGTQRQWSRETADASEEPADTPTAENDAVRCVHCGAQNSPYAERCSHCGSALDAQDWHAAAHTPPEPPAHHGFHEYSPFHSSPVFCGGVKPEAVLEGESAKDLAAVVRTNIPYYLPRFERMSKGNQLSWNWAACLFSSMWLLFRKQYVAGILMLLLEIFNAFTLTAAASFFPSVFEKTSYAEQVNELLFLMQTDARLAGILQIVSLLCFVMLTVRIVLAIIGNRLYMRQCLRTVSKARAAYPEGYQAQLSLTGGTSFALALVGYMTMYLVPDFLFMLLF